MKRLVEVAKEGISLRQFMERIEEITRQSEDKALELEEGLRLFGEEVALVGETTMRPHSAQDSL